MPDPKTRQRVQKLRQNRKARGQTETNVWVPTEVRRAIDAAVAAGRFASRRMAIIHALEQAFAPGGGSKS